jgi:hypothetical protein
MTTLIVGGDRGDTYKEFLRTLPVLFSRRSIGQLGQAITRFRDRSIAIEPAPGATS